LLPAAGLAVRAWNLLQIPGTHLALVAEVLGIEDLEGLLELLLVIRGDQGR
jgi:hypothetical protein